MEKKLINVIPDDYNEDIHSLVEAGYEVTTESEIITYVAIYKKDVLVNERNIDIINDVIEKLADLDGLPSKTFLICNSNFKKLTNEQVIKILDKNWSIAKGVLF